jgi:hypothetical protein
MAGHGGEDPMTTTHRTRVQHSMLAGLLITATSFALVGILVSGDDGHDGTAGSAATTTTQASAAVQPADTGSTPPPSVGIDASEEPTGGLAATSTGNGQRRTTADCRADLSCPSSEHRTGDRCEAAIIVDTAGYLEGRHDAEDGLPYRIDQAPAPGPADDDDDDGTVGPATLYRAGYVQGWCDGGGAAPGSR